MHLHLTGQVPTVQLSNGQTVAIPAGTLSLAGYAPIVGGDITVPIPVGGLTLTGSGPAIYNGTGPAWAKGTPFLVLGVAGDGRIDLLAYDGKPRVTFVVQGATYNAQSERAIIGNLNGYYGYVSDIYGAAFGVPTAAWLKIDPTNGLRIGHNTAVNVSVDASGNALFSGQVSLGSTSSFQATSAITFTRNTGQSWGQAGDINSLYALAPDSGHHSIDLVNILKGTADSPECDASIALRANGWSDTGSGASIGETKVELVSSESLGKTITATADRLDVIGALTVTTSVRTYGKTSPTTDGVMTAVSFDATNFTAVGATWTVASGDQTHFWLEVSNKMCAIYFELATTDLSVASNELRIKIPPNVTGGDRTATATVRALLARQTDNAALIEPVTGFAYVTSGNAYISIFKDGALGNWTSGTGVLGVAGYLRFPVNI